jgi:lyso-ornithine lipid O-acyltransferase
MAADSPAVVESVGTPEHASPHRAGIAFGILRSVIRSAGFALVLSLAAIDYVRSVLLSRHREMHSKRALWLHRWSQIVAWIIGLRLHHYGTPPTSGMIVSNHLSYLDILCYSALEPCLFVAKKEVGNWPILGPFARIAGTIFVDRTRKMDVADANLRIAEALHAGTPVVLFAEGTSSDGRTVLPFRSSLLQPAVLSHCTVPAAIHYHLDDGSVSNEVCYWGDMTLLPHLLKLFAKRNVQAHVTFGACGFAARFLSRKNAAQQLHGHVIDLHTALKKKSV